MVVILVFLMLLVVTLVFSAVMTHLSLPDDYPFPFNHGHLWRWGGGAADLQPYAGGADIDPDSYVGCRGETRHANHTDCTGDGYLLQIHLPVHAILPFVLDLLRLPGIQIQKNRDADYDTSASRLSR